MNGIINFEITDELIEIGRKAIEDELIERRDARIGVIGRNNGLVVKEMDGSPSEIIRMSVPDALRTGLKAMQDHAAKTVLSAESVPR